MTTAMAASAQGKSAVVIGAGLGGIAAAVGLATRGFDVAIYEKNDKIVDSAMAAEASLVSLLSWEERIYKEVDVGKAK